MSAKIRTMDLTLTRVIPASPGEAFDAWLDRDTPGTVWEYSKKTILPKKPKVDDFFYMLTELDDDPNPKRPHYGRFLQITRPAKVQYTWMSMNTRGLESIVTVTFKKKGEDTLLTLNHANLPDDEWGKAHQEGWAYFLEAFGEHFESVKA